MFNSKKARLEQHPTWHYILTRTKFFVFIISSNFIYYPPPPCSQAVNSSAFPPCPYFIRKGHFSEFEKKATQTLLEQTKKMPMKST